MLCQERTIKIFRTMALLSLLVGLSGCSTWLSSDFEEPRRELAKAVISRARLLEQPFMRRCRISSPNARSLPVRGLAYTGHISGIEIASGESSGWLTVPAHGFDYYEVPV